MKRIVVSAVLFLLVLSLTAFAGVSVDVRVSLPRIELRVPPVLVVVPGTYVYAAPEVEADIVFYQGFWWRPYGGSWYRSHEYNGAWTAMPSHSVPVPVRNLPPNWKQVPPGHERLPYGQVKQNWPVWEREKRWERGRASGGRAVGVGVPGQPMPAPGGRAVGVGAEGRPVPAPAPGPGGQYRDDRPDRGSRDRYDDDRGRKDRKAKKSKKDKRSKGRNGGYDDQRDDRGRGDDRYEGRGSDRDRDDDRGKKHNDRRKPGRDDQDRYDNDDRYDDRGRRR